MMVSFQDVINGEITQSGFAITTPEAKAIKRTAIATFVSTYGDGTIGLTEAQKLNRVAKYIGNAVEIEKVLGLGSNVSSGVSLSNRDNLCLNVIDENRTEIFDNIPAETISNITNYPKSQHSPEDLRIVYAEIGNDGSIMISMIHNNEKLNDPKEREYSSILFFDDYTSALNEAKQYADGKLKAVSDRTMNIHDSEGILDTLLEDDSVNTNADDLLQI